MSSDDPTPSRRILSLILTLCLGVACASDPSAETTADADSASERNDPVASSETTALAGTRWRLVQFQSMDDAIGTIRPEDPAAFTMALDADGSVAMALDCNRANGSWQAEPSADGTSGSFTFGPLAMTRALCPPPNLDERIGRDAEYVRSYLLRDGRLHLSLMADGGIYTWEPDRSIGARTDPSPELEDALRRAEPDYRAEIVGDGPRARYAWAEIDLDGDGTEEVLAYLLGPFFCGSGGCSLKVLRQDADGSYAEVASLPISRLPVHVAATETDGWRDLYRRESGGGAEPSVVHHVWNGSTYVARERLGGDAELPEGDSALAGDVSYESGHELAPGGG